MRINIIGRGEGWEEGYEAPGEHWAINYWHPKADALLEIHPDYHTHPKLDRERENAEAAGTLLWDHKIIKELSSYFRLDYFGSTADFAIAWVIYTHRYVDEPIEIHLYGVNMDDRGDHYEKRCATDFWCGVAIGRGIQVVVHGNSTVMTTADGLIYGVFKPMTRRYENVGQ